MTRLQEEVKRRVSRRLESNAWFRSVPDHLVPSEEQIKSVGLLEASMVLERWMKMINEKKAFRQV